MGKVISEVGHHVAERLERGGDRLGEGDKFSRRGHRIGIGRNTGRLQALLKQSHLKVGLHGRQGAQLVLSESPLGADMDVQGGSKR